MTEIREPNYSVDLPGEWTPAEAAEPGSFSYVSADGMARLSVLLLAVRPMFTIADPGGVLGDYLHHRPQFEKGRSPGLEQTEPTSRPDGDGFLGEWSAYDPITEQRLAHRIRLADNLLADFLYEEAGGASAEEFSARAEAVLSTASAQP